MRDAFYIWNSIFDRQTEKEHQKMKKKGKQMKFNMRKNVNSVRLIFK